METIDVQVGSVTVIPSNPQEGFLHSNLNDSSIRMKLYVRHSCSSKPREFAIVVIVNI